MRRERWLLGRWGIDGRGRPTSHDQTIRHRIEIEHALVRIATQRVVVLELVVRVDVGHAVVARKVHGQADRHDDHDRLEHVELPAHEHEYGNRVGDGERDGHDGVDADQNVARREQQSDQGDEHGGDERWVGARDQLVLQVVESERHRDVPARVEAVRCQGNLEVAFSSLLYFI